MEEGLIVNENFTGCIENMYLNHSNVIAGFKSGIAYDDRFFNYEDVGGVIKGCPSDDYTAPVTFMNSDAFVKLTGYVCSICIHYTFDNLSHIHIAAMRDHTT